MRHIKENRIASITAGSENANYPADNVLDSHPSKPWKAEDGVSSTVITAEVNYGVSDVAIFGTNAASATVAATDPNEISWGDDDVWGTEIPAVADYTQLVTNGTFDSNISGWIDESWGTGTVAWQSGGFARLTRGVDADNRGQLTQEIITEVGQTYNLLIKNDSSSPGRAGLIVDKTFIDTIEIGEKLSLDLEAIGTATEIKLFSATNNSYCDIDFVSARITQDSDTWANTTITTPSVTQYQRSTSEALWLQLADTIDRPAELAITLTAPVGETVYAGVMRSSIAETYGGNNPKYGLSIGGLDTSIEAEMSNGSRYYKKRNVLRQVGVEVLMTTNSAFEVIKFYQQYGKTETAWKLTDLNSNEWVLFGYIEPSTSYDYLGRSTVNIQFTEVL